MIRCESGQHVGHLIIREDRKSISCIECGSFYGSWANAREPLFVSRLWGKMRGAPDPEPEPAPDWKAVGKQHPECKKAAPYVPKNVGME